MTEDAFAALKTLKLIEQGRVERLHCNLERLYQEVVDESVAGNRVRLYLSKKDGNLRWLDSDGVNVAIWDTAVPTDASIYRECLSVSDFVKKYVTTPKDVTDVFDNLTRNEVLI